VGGLPQSAEVRKPSLASLISAIEEKPVKKSTYWTYIVSLGYVGAKEALWHEWRNFPEDLYPEVDPRGELFSEPVDGLRKLQVKKKKVEIFTLALLIAKDSEHVREVITDFFDFQSPPNPPKQFTSDGRPRKSLTGEGSSSTSAMLKPFQGMLDPDDSSQQPSLQLSHEFRQNLLWYYNSNNLVPEKRLLERLRSKVFPYTPEAVLQAIDDWLVPDWIESMESMHAPVSDSFTQYHIGWVEQCSVEGIAIKRGFYGENLCFKPSSRSSSSADTETPSDMSHASADE
jgi:hypothetical protein